MKKILNSFVLNAILAFIAAFDLIYQEIGLGIASKFGMIMIGLVGAIGGSWLGEAISAIAIQKKANYAHVGVGAAIGFILALVCLIL